ncbi:hypothetical protein ACFL0W_02040 [Nanoarchaeota archaeon]
MEPSMQSELIRRDERLRTAFIRVKGDMNVLLNQIEVLKASQLDFSAEQFNSVIERQNRIIEAQQRAIEILNKKIDALAVDAKIQMQQRHIAALNKKIDHVASAAMGIPTPGEALAQTSDMQKLKDMVKSHQSVILKHHYDINGLNSKVKKVKTPAKKKKSTKAATKKKSVKKSSSKKSQKKKTTKSSNLDRKLISFSQNHEVKHVLKKYGKSQSKDNIKRLKEIGKIFKASSLNKPHNRENFYKFLKKSQSFKKLK